MRIIGGTARGHPLKTPSNELIRPTSDKVRLAIFNALYSRGGVAGKMVLDAFCGTGAMGCEALSQGARAAIFCDKAPPSLKLAKENVAALGFSNAAQFFMADSSKIPSRAALSVDYPANIVFLDPPYRKGLIQPALEVLRKGDWLSDDALIVIEVEHDFTLETLPFGRIDFDKTYGETRVVFLRGDDGFHR